MCILVDRLTDHQVRNVVKCHQIDSTETDIKLLPHSDGPAVFHRALQYNSLLVTDQHYQVHLPVFEDSAGVVEVGVEIVDTQLTRDPGETVGLCTSEVFEAGGSVGGFVEVPDRTGYPPGSYKAI